MANSIRVITLEEACELIETNKWQHAVKHPENPHDYTMRRTWSSNDDFDAFVYFVQHSGMVKYFYNKIYIYINIGGYQYWTMGYHPRWTTLVNRARLEDLVETDIA